MRAVVLGACGAVGREVARGLVAADAVDRVTLADTNAAGLRALRSSIEGSVDTRVVEGSDARSLRAALRGSDLVANCTTYVLGVQVLRAAITERVDYLDLGGLYNTPKQLAMHEAAERAGIRAVIGCGATPGLSNVLVRRAADRLDEVHEIHVSFASFRDVAPSPGLLDTLLDEFRPGVPRFFWRAGELRDVGPFEGARRVRFAKPVGAQEVFYVPHSETHTLPRSFGDRGLREVAVRGTWRPEDMRLLAGLSRLGLTSEDPIRVGSLSVRPLDVLRATLLAHPPTEPSAFWAFFLHVEVAGTSDGEHVLVQQRTGHPTSWGTDATGRATAVPAVVGATLLARGASRPGVLPPEQAFEPAQFLGAVKRSGVDVSLSSRRRSHG